MWLWGRPWGLTSPASLVSRTDDANDSCGWSQAPGLSSWQHWGPLEMDMGKEGLGWGGGRHVEQSVLHSGGNAFPACWMRGDHLCEGGDPLMIDWNRSKFWGMIPPGHHLRVKFSWLEVELAKTQAFSLLLTYSSHLPGLSKLWILTQWWVKNEYSGLW